MRQALRESAPFFVMLSALIAVVVLPELAFAWTEPGHPGEFGGALRAHVAWARAIAIIVALVASGMLAKSARPRGGRVGAVATIALCAGVGATAALPFYDQWIAADVRAHYAAPGWRAEASEGGVDLLMFSSRSGGENVTDAQELTFPSLEKGDRYHAFASFRGGDPAGFWRSEVSLDPGDPCFSSEGALPTTPDGRGGGEVNFLRDCSARAAGSRTFAVKWGSADEPVDIAMGVLVIPVKAVEVDARVDDSLVLVAVVGGLAASLGSAVGIHRSRSPALVLAVPPLLICILWMVAALAPRERAYAPGPDAASAGAFALLAAAAAAFAAVRMVLAARGLAPEASAVRASALGAATVTMLVPFAATRIFLDVIPWIVLAMIASLLVCASTLGALARPSRVASDATRA